MPKVQMSIALVAIYLSAFGQLPLEQYVYVFFVSVISCLFFDLVISYIRSRKLFIPHAAMVTGMIITLLVDPTLAWHKIALIGLFAMLAKNFVRINNKHLFNPAASGLLIGGLILNSRVAWWGSSFQYSGNFDVRTILLYIILFSPLYISAFRMRRYLSILSFTIAYLILITVVPGNFSFNAIINTLINPTLIFFSTIMLPEPMTSPSRKNKQILFGVAVALLGFIFSSNFFQASIFIPDVFLASLLVSDLIFFKK